MLIIKGKITSVSGSGSNAPITIYGKKVSSSSYNANFQTLINSKSDNNGNFNIEIEKENISEYKMIISKSKYFKTEELFYSSSFSNNIFSKNIPIYPSANINIKVKNISPVNNDDYFRYKIASGYVNNIGCCSETKTFEGVDIDEEYNCKIVGLQNVVFEWLKVKNNQTTTGTETIYCSIDSDNFIELNY